MDFKNVLILTFKCCYKYNLRITIVILKWEETKENVEEILNKKCLLRYNDVEIDNINCC